MSVARMLQSMEDGCQQGDHQFKSKELTRTSSKTSLEGRLPSATGVVDSDVSYVLATESCAARRSAKRSIYKLYRLPSCWLLPTTVLVIFLPAAFCLKSAIFLNSFDL